jgi:U4/U6.U5 tri-snRNP-associated protein 2
MSLFKEKNDQSTIPQEYIVDLLDKYDGKTKTNVKDNQVMYRISTLPQILVIQIKRFIKNNYFIEKNPSVVITPLDSGVDMKKCMIIMT